MIYMDHAATTPPREEALQMYVEVSKNFFGNSSSLHDMGTQANQLLENCRNQLGNLLHAEKDGIYFTSGGSESNVLALQSLIEANNHKGNHLITTRIEHSSILHFFARMETFGYEVTYLPVDSNGLIDLEELKEAIREETILASIQHGNGEIGTIQPIKAIGSLLHAQGVLFHSDCVQTFCKQPLALADLPIDSISVSSHKVYGPKGVGAVYINPSVPFRALLPDTTHEKGFRPGTVNVPGIAAFVTAAELLHEEMTANQERYKQLRSAFIELLSDKSSNVVIEGGAREHLPHILGVRFPGIQGQYVMLECNRNGLAISTGSACSSGQQDPSKTIKAIGRTDEQALEFIRFSFGRETTKAEITEAARILNTLLAKFFITQ
ncbi:aminotransferase class V-fold PLP-dependent enzyme [Sediminibacillus dalangtanensis]|uniref:Aminotransferase class V-fold PLP-dependent enzyme n=1 Tax=Sediminibacillus dalangtanensis TaxID=2729421 RepID=A0ABX7VXI6_9BACI|nr:IscS subfamily cysteine desulfurase [Sediminibacillus dalangtanensis]QTN01259.1 aminotransferase class V-fold PLP-dependent enzyme [Sediminibacillus dalangtanensis]